MSLCDTCDNHRMDYVTTEAWGVVATTEDGSSCHERRADGDYPDAEECTGYVDAEYAAGLYDHEMDMRYEMRREI